MNELNYAPVKQTLSYQDPRYDKFDVLHDQPYAATDYYKYGYATLVAKEWNACPTEVMKLYFSEGNIKRLQKQIRKEIYKRSNGKFRLEEDQDVLDLITAMRAVYEMYGKDLPKYTVRQVKMLNAETVQYIAPDMMTNLKQHYGYLDDIKNPINPIMLPLNVNRSGRNLLRGVAQVYGI